MSVEGLLARLLQLADEGLRRARAGDTFCMKLVDGVGYDTLTVITDSDFLHVIPENKASVVRSVYLHMETVSDIAHVEFGYTENVDGSGKFTSFCGNLHLETPAQVSSTGSPSSLIIDPPFYVKYSQGKAVTCRILANDANAKINVSAIGWDEAYRRLSN